MRNSLKRSFVLAILAIASVSITVNVLSAVDNITVIVNGQEVLFPDQRPVIVDDRTLVPVRGVFEAIGFVVDWDEETSTALLSDSEGVFNITIQIGEPHFSVGVFNPDMPVGHANIVALDVPAQIIGGRTMLPLRAVLESAGYRLDWDETTRTINIASASENGNLPNESMANIQMDFAGEDLKEQYTSFHEFVHNEEASWLIFTSDATVTNLEFFEVISSPQEHSERMQLSIGDSLFSAPDLTPDRPFFVRTFTYWPTTGQQFGISFTDTDNTQRYILIDGSMGNAMAITEFRPHV